MSYELQEIGRLHERVDLLEEVLDHVSKGEFKSAAADLKAKKAAADEAKKPLVLTPEEVKSILEARKAAQPLELTDEEKEAVLKQRAAS